MPVRTTTCLGVLVLLGAHSLVSQAPDVPATPGSVPTVPSLKTVKVHSVSLLEDRASGRAVTPVRAGFQDMIVLKVVNLDSLVRNAKCLSAKDLPVPNCREHAIVLFLAGREIKGLEPESGAALPDEGRLQFHLERSTDSANGEVWADLLGAPGLRGNSFYYRPAEVSVGLEDGYPVDTRVSGKDFELIRLRPAWFVGTSVVFGVVLVSLAVLAMTSELLRDVGPAPVGERKGWFFTRRARKPYSLGRVQMAFWFVLVVGSFLFIWLVTGSSDTVTASVLALIGIGAGAGLGSAVIDLGKDQTDDNDLKQMEAEEPVLKNEIQDLEQAIKKAAPPDVPALVAVRTEKQARLKRIADRIPALKESQKPQASAGFFRDLLNDPVEGIGFHRFQMVVWTLVLGILFLRSVWERLAMPEFSATLLALLGISAGTFLGFKVPEGKSRS